ncbi:MAG TPA: hypothetical protein VFJ47_13265 [Terriglobales bacterium]|nr:hypothetical protein [Terriglobales bacterium]
MQRRYRVLAVSLLVFALFTTLSAVAYAQRNDITRSELSSFDAYLDKHHDVRDDLNKNPNLINDQNYLAKHPHLREFLEQHPNVREELKENPSAFMQRENSLEKNEGSAKPQGNSDITNSELRNWDEYIDKHRDVQADLSKNPNLIDDPKYLSSHPHLREFLEKHPNTREELKENPQKFLNREKQYEKNEDKKHH